jgi:hypothetical protein
VTGTCRTSGGGTSVFAYSSPQRGLFSPLFFFPFPLYPSFSFLLRAERAKFFLGLAMNELTIIQKTYDLIKWYVPIINRLPRNHKFTLGDRMIIGLYEFLEGLITAKYAKEKLIYLEPLNVKLDILRHQTRLLLDFKIMKVERYEYVGQLIKDIGNELGGWIKQQRQSI